MPLDMPPVIEYASQALENTLPGEKVVHNGGVATFSISAISFTDALLSLDQNIDQDDPEPEEEEEEELDVDAYIREMFDGFRDRNQDPWGEPYSGRSTINNTRGSLAIANMQYSGKFEPQSG